MTLQNKLGITNHVKLATPDEKINNQKIKHLLQTVLTNKTHNHETFINGIYASYYYEDCSEFKTEDL